MKGIVFNLAEEVVSSAYSDEAWDAVLDAAGVVGSYTSLGNYSDDELARIVTAAAHLLGVDDSAVLRTVGEGAIPLLAHRYPHFFTAHRNARSLVLALNSIIHPEVRKLYADASPPSFNYQTQGENGVVLGYRSARRLCALAEGFVLGTAAWYGQTVTITQSACMLDGADQCVMHCDFSDVPS